MRRAGGKGRREEQERGAGRSRGEGQWGETVGRDKRERLETGAGAWGRREGQEG